MLNLSLIDKISEKRPKNSLIFSQYQDFRICNPTTAMALQMPILSTTGLQIPPSGEIIYEEDMI